MADSRSQFWTGQCRNIELYMESWRNFIDQTVPLIDKLPPDDEYRDVLIGRVQTWMCLIQRSEEEHATYTSFLKPTVNKI